MNEKMKAVYNTANDSIRESGLVMPFLQSRGRVAVTLVMALRKIEGRPTGLRESLEWIFEPDALAEFERLAPNEYFAWRLLRGATNHTQAEDMDADRISLADVKNAACDIRGEMERFYCRFTGLPSDTETTAKLVAHGMLLWDYEGKRIVVNPIWRRE